MNDVLQSTEDVHSPFGALQLPLFISNTPENHRGMVPVAPDQIRHVLTLLPRDAGHPKLIHHQHAQTVTAIEQRRVGRIMTRANRIASVALQLLNPPHL